MAILVVVLLCAGGFGAWLALRAGEWLSSFAAAPSWRGLVHGGTNWVLFCWFADWSWRAASPPFLESDKLGLDARIYLRGAQAWLSGGDPWNATVQFHDAGTYGFHFAAPPPSVLLCVPFAWVPEDLFVAAVIVAGFAAGFYVLRSLGLPPWWIVFPPLTIGILSGNPVVIGMALLLCGRTWAAPIAFAAKIYLGAGLVAERRWRDLALVAFALAAMAVMLLPLWMQYVADYSSISANIAHESAGGFSATRAAPLFAFTAVMVALLALVDWRAACWLAVPALAPFAEFHASIFALPVISPGLAVLLAMAGQPADAFAPWAICAYSAWRVAWAGAGLAGLHMPEPLAEMGRLARPCRDPAGRPDPAELTRLAEPPGPA